MLFIDQPLALPGWPLAQRLFPSAVGWPIHTKWTHCNVYKRNMCQKLSAFPHKYYKNSIIISKFNRVLSREKSFKVLRLLKVESAMRFQPQPPSFRSTFPHQSSGKVILSQKYEFYTTTLREQCCISHASEHIISVLGKGSKRKTGKLFTFGG